MAGAQGTRFSNSSLGGQSLESSYFGSEATGREAPPSGVQFLPSLLTNWPLLARTHPSSEAIGKRQKGAGFPPPQSARLL